MTHNTVIAPWGGKGIGIYGGCGHHVENNYLADTARYIGLGVGRFGVNGSDMTGATVSGNVVVRAGGNAYVQGQPAMQIGNGGDGQSTGTVSNAVVTGNTIIDSVYDSVGFSTGTGNTLADNQIISPWRNGIVISPPFYPAPSGNATITGNSVTGVAAGKTAYANDSSGFTATLTGNSWQNGTGGALTAGRRPRCRARCRRPTTTPAGRGGLQRHLGQRHRQQLPVRRGGPGNLLRHPVRRMRGRPRLDAARASGSGTPSTWPPPGPTRSASGSPPPTG